MLKLPPQPDHCELCQRPVTKLTRHHLIPKHLHRKKRFQKLFTKEELITRTLWVWSADPVTTPFIARAPSTNSG